MKYFDVIDRAGLNLKQILGENPSKVTIYTINNSVSRSNMSADITAYIIKNNHPIGLCRTRVNGCGLDRGFELAYNIFISAYPKLRYQETLQHHWL